MSTHVRSSIYCFIGCGFYAGSLFCGFVLGVPSNHFTEDERDGCFTFIFLRKRELVALLCVLAVRIVSYSAAGWSAVCDCGISWSYSLAFASLNLASIK